MKRFSWDSPSYLHQLWGKQLMCTSSGELSTNMLRSSWVGPVTHSVAHSAITLEQNRISVVLYLLQFLYFHAYADINKILPFAQQEETNTVTKKLYY
jgi:hypothetical protein